MNLFRYQAGALTPLSVSVQAADTFLTRLKGLLGTVSIPENFALWINPCTSILMFGMLYSIDVVFLTANGEINKIAAGVLPFGFSNGPNGAVSVLEMKKGTAAKLNLKVGDRLVIQ